MTLLNALMRRFLQAIHWCGICDEFHTHGKFGRFGLATGEPYTYSMKGINIRGEEVPVLPWTTVDDLAQVDEI